MNLVWTKRIELTDIGVSRIKEIAGVYRLIYFDAARNKYYVHYTGQATNLKERLAQHLPTSETNSCCKQRLQNFNCYFRAAAITTQVGRDGAEVALYSHFTPTCGERAPSVVPVEINYE